MRSAQVKVSGAGLAFTLHLRVTSAPVATLYTSGWTGDEAHTGRSEKEEKKRGGKEEDDNKKEDNEKEEKKRRIAMRCKKLVRFSVRDQEQKKEEEEDELVRINFEVFI